jgi:hypothetical protein
MLVLIAVIDRDQANLVSRAGRKLAVKGRAGAVWRWPRRGRYNSLIQRSKEAQVLSLLKPRTQICGVVVLYLSLKKASRRRSYSHCPVTFGAKLFLGDTMAPSLELSLTRPKRSSTS